MRPIIPLFCFFALFGCSEKQENNPYDISDAERSVNVSEEEIADIVKRFRERNAPQITKKETKALESEFFKPKAKTGWYINLGEYSDQIEAEIAAASLSYKGLGATVINYKKLFLVVKGYYTEKEYAQKALNELKEEDLSVSGNIIRVE